MAEVETAAPPAAPPPARPLGAVRRLPVKSTSGQLGKPGSLQLNQSTSPQVQALPVKRRGSFQQLKKAPAVPADDSNQSGPSNLDQDSTPSIFAIVKKSTHWEKYGTVLVLFTADELGTDKDAVLQLLSAEGYDDQVASCAEETLKLFCEKEVYPDIVLIDSDNKTIDVIQLIKQVQHINPTVAVLVLGSKGGPLTAVQALQAGAADYMLKPLDLDELIARVERHVQRQHCIKLELEKALEDTKQLLSQLPAAPNSATQPSQSQSLNASLISVAETDFEEQMAELCEENQRLGMQLQELERQLELRDCGKTLLEAKLQPNDEETCSSSNHCRQLGMVAQDAPSLSSL